MDMKRAFSIMAALPLVVIFGGAASELPNNVKDHLVKMDKDCSDNGGQPDPKSSLHGGRGLVQHGLLARGATEVWVVDEGKYQCDGAASVFSGSGGAQVIVFARLNDGSVKHVFEHGAFGASLKRIGASPELLLRVGGRLCGQTGDPSHADAIVCDRPLIWSRATHKMDFAPLSQVRPVAGDGHRR
jgi:hypothetical protein